MYVIMKNAGLSTNDINNKNQMEKDIDEIRSKLSKTDSEFINEKNRLQTEIAKLKDLSSKLEVDNKTLQTDYIDTSGQCKTLKEENKNLESQIIKLNNDLSEYN